MDNEKRQAIENLVNLDKKLRKRGKRTVFIERIKRKASEILTGVVVGVITAVILVYLFGIK